MAAPPPATSPPDEGRVYPVGAGPGDLGLLTLRARDLLASANSVLHDQIGHPEVLAHAPRNAERVNVGKVAAHSCGPGPSRHGRGSYGRAEAARSHGHAHRGRPLRRHPRRLRQSRRLAGAAGAGTHTGHPARRGRAGRAGGASRGRGGDISRLRRKMAWQNDGRRPSSRSL
jgi:hypothetical protein